MQQALPALQTQRAPRPMLAALVLQTLLARQALRQPGLLILSAPLAPLPLLPVVLPGLPVRPVLLPGLPVRPVLPLLQAPLAQQQVLPVLPQMKTFPALRALPVLKTLPQRKAQ